MGFYEWIYDHLGALGHDVALPHPYKVRAIEQALMRKGRRIRLIQVPKAERDIAVAAASVLTRDVFLRKFEGLRESYMLDFPKGATHVVEFGRKLVETHVSACSKTSPSCTSRLRRRLLAALSRR